MPQSKPSFERLIDFSDEGEYEFADTHIQQIDMICSWRCDQTKLILHRLKWHSGAADTYHLMVIDEAAPTRPPVVIGLNHGLDDIEDAIAVLKRAPDSQRPDLSKELLLLIEDTNPDVVGLIQRSSSNYEAFLLAKASSK